MKHIYFLPSKRLNDLDIFLNMAKRVQLCTKKFCLVLKSIILLRTEDERGCNLKGNFDCHQFLISSFLKTPRR